MGYKGSLQQGKRPGRRRSSTLEGTNSPGQVVVAVPTQGIDQVDDVQTVTSDGTGGTFTLATGSDVTGTIAWNATVGTVETAVETLTEYTAATVTGSAGAWVITNVDGDDSPGETLVVDDALLTGGSAVLVHTTTGVSESDEIASFYVDGDTGTFTLSYAGQTTATIVYSANAALIDTRLTALSTIADVAVTGTGTGVDPFVVTFTDPAGAATAITADTALLTRNVAAADRA